MLSRSGPLSFSQIQAEFGDQDNPDTAAISLGEYYRNGPNVPEEKVGSYVQTGTSLQWQPPGGLLSYHNGIVVSPGLGVGAAFVLNTGIVQIQRYWRDIDADADPPLCPPNRVGLLGRGGGETFAELGNTSYPRTDLQIYFVNNQEVGRFERPNWPKSSGYQTGVAGFSLQSGRMAPSGYSVAGPNINLRSAPAGTGFFGSNPYGGSYKVTYIKYKELRNVSTSVTINTKVDINQTVPDQGNPIKFPDNYYGTTNKTS